MKNDWIQTTIGNICEGIYDGPHATPMKTEEGPIFLGISCLVNGRLDLSQAAYLSEKDFRKWTRRITPRPGDVVFSYETRLGEAAIIPNGLRCCLGRRMGLLRPDQSVVNSRFLLYAYLGPEFQSTISTRSVHGSTVSRILLTELPDYPVIIPPLPIQQRIVDILGALDDKIELNRKMNRTLEAMAQALYKEWFVDFGPFQDGAFEDSELGPIPEGWKTTTLASITTKIGSGATPRGGSQAYVDEGINFIRSQNVYDNQFDWSGLVYITDEAAEKLKSVTIEDGDVLINITGHSILRTCMVDPMLLPARVNQHVSIIRTIPSVPSQYILLYLLRPETKNYLAGFSAGATRKAITKGHLQNLPVLLPPTHVLDEFEQITQTMFESMFANNAESITLAVTRDYLLPKLLSGEIEVEAVEESLRESL